MLKVLGVIFAVILLIAFEEQKQSVAGWLADVVNGDLKDYGLDLVNKKY